MNEERKTCKVTVLFDGADFERLDRYCNEFAFKKSTLIARLVREYLERENYRPAKNHEHAARPARGEK